MLKLTKSHFKSSIVMFLMCTLLLTFNVGVAMAANAKTMHEQILDTGAKYDTPEYYALTKAWSDYFLDLLPDSSNPETLQLLTKLPEYDVIENNTLGWNDFFGDGDPVLMRNEVFRLAKELGVDNPDWSIEQKIARLDEWFGRNGASLEWDGPPYYYGLYDGPLNWNKRVDGYLYDCTTIASGAVALYRLAGIPATPINLLLYGESHVEPFFYDGSTWRNPRVSRYDTGSFTDYFKNIDARYVISANTGRRNIYVMKNEEILDINETWINGRTEFFIFQLLQTPYAHPEKALTRGEVAKIVCNFLSVVPMRNEQIFSDVPVGHKYSSYIWAMNSLGIMNGVGGGAFNPDGILTMQEFAVIAARVSEYGKESIAKKTAEELAEIEGDPIGWPPDLKYTQDTVRRLKEKVTLFDPPANSAPKTFKDAAKIADWAKPTIDDFSRFGILEGDGNGYLNPTEQLSRTRFLVFMYKFERQFDIFIPSATPTPIF
jgi:hypothetical protein